MQSCLHTNISVYAKKAFPKQKISSFKLLDNNSVPTCTFTEGYKTVYIFNRQNRVKANTKIHRQNVLPPSKFIRRVHVVWLVTKACYYQTTLSNLPLQLAYNLSEHGNFPYLLSKANASHNSPHSVHTHPHQTFQSQRSRWLEPATEKKFH